MTESTWWKAMLPKLQRPGIRWTRHTDLTAGISDVSYTIKGEEKSPFGKMASCSGWIELKYNPKYPVKPDTIITPRCEYTAAQRLFTRREIDCGGRAFILWRIHNDIYLFYGRVANKIGSSTKEELASCARKVWNHRSPELYDELIEELKR